MDLLLGIDLGTSGVKAGVFDETGRLCAMGRASPYRFSSPQPGWAESLTEPWWDGIVAAVRQALTSVDSASVVAIGLSTFFPTVVALDADGTALLPAILYADQRSTDQVLGISRALNLDEYQMTIGNRLAPGNCGVASMSWIRDERPDAYKAAVAIGFANTFVLRRLTGEAVTDISNASLSGLTEVGKPGVWREDLCEQTGIDRHRLARICGSTEVAGTLTTEAAEALGLIRGTPVVPGSGDTAASALGAGVALAGQAVYSSGTTENLSLVSASPVKDLRWINVAYLQPGQWLWLGATSASGLSLEWFAREILDSPGNTTLITELAEGAKPGQILFLPYLQGERTPVWDSQARGVFLGISAATGRADLARGVLEGIALSLRHMVDSLETITGRPLSALPSVGGGTRNAVWNQIKADVTQRPLDVLQFQETASLGAALMAGIGIGMYSDVAAAAEIARRVQRVRRVTPREHMADRYRSLYSSYRGLYEGTRDIMCTLAKERLDG